MSNERVFNFSAGPATLPEEVLKTAQEEMLNYKGAGMSVMEMSHRSKDFMAIHQKTKENLSEALKIPNSHEVLLLQGGASTQFAMVPMNFLNGKSADMLITGSWTQKALKEVKKLGTANIVGSSEDKNFSYIPKGPFDWSDEAAYSFITSNNTIFGTQFKEFPNTPTPLVCDMSSDILSRKINVSDFHLIFAGAQKNLGPSGVTVVIIDKNWAKGANSNIPTMLQYGTHIDKDSMFNTPPTYAIYILGLVTQWVLDKGGVEEIERHNNEKAQLLYNAIDNSDYFYCPVDVDSRSTMNVVMRIKGDDEELESKFIAEATQAGLNGLKGHRSVGGLRASIYNAFPREGVEKLVQKMEEFKANNPL